jgi:hypothetical protein
MMLLKLMAIFLTRAHEYPDATHIFLVFLEDPKPYLEASEQYVRFVFSAYQVCDAVRQPCLAVLAKALISDKRDVALIARAAFCQIEFMVIDIPIVEILAGRRDAYLAVAGVEVLARAPISRHGAAC